MRDFQLYEGVTDLETLAGREVRNRRADITRCEAGYCLEESWFDCWHGELMQEILCGQ